MTRMVEQIARQGRGRRPRRRGRGAASSIAHAPTHLLGRLADGDPRPQAPRAASSPTSSTATSTTRTSASRAATSARSTGRSARATATCSASRRSSARSTRRSPSAATSCCCRAGTTPTCRSQWYEDLFRAVKARYPGVQAARAVAARGPAHLAAEPASGPRRSSSGWWRPASTAFPAAAPRFSSIASASC